MTLAIEVVEAYPPAREMFGVTDLQCTSWHPVVCPPTRLVTYAGALAWSLDTATPPNQHRSRLLTEPLR